MRRGLLHEEAAEDSTLDAARRWDTLTCSPSCFCNPLAFFVNLESKDGITITSVEYLILSSWKSQAINPTQLPKKERFK